jgi:hypothetical protein
LFAPGALADELLERLLGVLAREAGWECDAPGERFDALALAVEQEPLEVHPGPPRRPGLREVRREAGRVLAESVEDRRIEFGVKVFMAR